MRWISVLRKYPSWIINSFFNGNQRFMKEPSAMFRFRKEYAWAALLLLLAEIFIAVFIHDGFIRPYFGDLLVVILIYCTVRSFFALPVWKTALSTLLFAYIIETLQYLSIVERLGLGNSRLANIIIGNAFAWMDMLMYTLGIAVVLLWEYTIGSDRSVQKEYLKK